MEGLKTKLEINDGVSNAWVEVLEATDIQVPEEKKARIKTATLSSAGSRRKKNSLGMVEDGIFTFKQVYNAAALTRLQALKDVVKDYRVTFPDKKRATIPVECLGATMDAITPEAEMMTAFEGEQRGDITWDTAP